MLERVADCAQNVFGDVRAELRETYPAFFVDLEQLPLGVSPGGAGSEQPAD